MVSYLKLFLNSKKFLHNLMQSLPHLENICHNFFLGGIYCCLFLFHTICRTKYMNHDIKNLPYGICNTSIELNQKIKSVPLIDVSNFP